MMTSGLVLTDIRHSFGQREVIAGISLSVGDGELLCLLGPSGCGKSTTLRLAAGLERLQHGKITIDGELMAGDGTFVPPERRGVGLVLQDYALFPHMSVLDNVAFGLREGTREERREIARGYLDSVGLLNFEASFPHTLSGGEQQRVALARALAPSPRVMLMDEPFSGLDVTTRAAVRRTSRRILKDRGVPSLIVTHDPDEALQLADRIAVMRDGRIVQEGPPERIFLDPEESYVMQLFGEPNALTGEVVGGQVATPFGPVGASGVADGSAVTVMFRGGALHLSGEGNGIAAIVTNARLMGAVERVRLEIESGDTLLMEQPRERALVPGDRVFVAATIEDFRVFPMSR